jgi:hypothetical protein
LKYDKTRLAGEEDIIKTNALIVKGRQKRRAPALAGEVSETTRGREHDESNVDVTKNGELVSLFNDPISTFGEGNLPIRRVFYSLNWEFNSTHLS